MRGVGNGSLDRLGRNFAVNHPPGLLQVESLLQVPANGFPFPVGVGGNVNLLGFF